MLYIAICDDERHVCDQIEEFIADYQKRKQAEIAVEIFLNGEDIYEKLIAGQFYDLIFTGIEMYEINGIAVGEYIREKQQNEITQIVFVSSKENYAMELFALRPLDFIIKPATYERIAACIDYVQKRKKQNKDVFSYRNGNKICNMAPDEILYFQSNARKVTMVHSNGSDEFYDKLDNIEMQLGEYPFLRIHKSFLVNYLWVKTIDNMDITMKDGAMLQISYPRRKKVYEQLNEIRKKGITSWN